MDKAEYLSKLKSLKIERGNGALFSSSDEGMQWIDKVLPLLKYDQQHYVYFYNHSQYVRIISLSADTLMAHLNPMIGIVSQAVIELENNIESPAEVMPVHNSVANPSDKKPLDANKSKSISPTKNFESVIGGLVLACALYLIATYFGLKLN